MRLALAAPVAALALAGVATASGQPTLRLVVRAPATIRGTGFAPHERVRLTLAAAFPTRLLVRTGGTGSFLARFEGVGLDRCSSYRVVAVGSRGERVVLKAQPLCAPAGSP